VLDAFACHALSVGLGDTFALGYLGIVRGGFEEAMLRR